MEAKIANVNHKPWVRGRVLPAVLPVLLISVGYVDPGKWAATVEGGAHFGFDLIAIMLVFNLAAILCQYLSARITIVTGRDLAQICSDEYDKFTCLFLGVQTELSLILLDMTMVLGIAHGLNIFLGMDLSTAVFLGATDAVMFPVFAGLVENYKANFLWICMAGVVLLSYVLGVLISQPEIPISMNGILTKLSGDSAFALMSLLGANIMPHNFYLHSSIVRQYQGQLDVSKDTLCHDHLFAILCVFCGIYLANYVLMNAAANVFYNTGLVLLTFQDAMSLMEQVLRSRVAPIAFVLVLFCSNQITSLSWNLGRQVVLHDFLRLDIPGWLHRATIRIIGIVPVLYCVWTSGAEGIYQLLIFTQVIVALLLPSSVFPLFRIASSRQIMGVHKISQILEFSAWITLIGMLVLKFMFVVEMIFGDSDWVGNLRWNGGGATCFPFIILLVVSFASLGLMLWLATTPLKSASTRIDAQVWSWDEQEVVPEAFTQKEEIHMNETRYLEESLQKQESVQPERKSTESQLETPVPNFDLHLPESIMESDQEIRLATIEENHSNITFPSPAVCHREQSPSSVGSTLESTGVSEVSDSDMNRVKNSTFLPSGPIDKTAGVDGDLRVEKEYDDGDTWETEEPSKDAPETTSSLNTDGPSSLRSLSGKSDDGGSGAGSLSRLVGLGRAARRQLAAILDEFWGQLYDFHGQLTQEARVKKLDVLLGLDIKAASSLKLDTAAKEYVGYYPTAGGRGSDSVVNSSFYDAPKQPSLQNCIDSSYGVQSGSTMWANQMQLLDPYVQNSSFSVQDVGERPYSSLRLPSEDYGERRYSSLRLPSEDSGERRYSNLRLGAEDSGERQYSSLHLAEEDSGERRYSSLRVARTDDSGERRYSSLCLAGTEDSGERRYSSLRLTGTEDSGERRYSSLRTTASSDTRNYQPATVHSYDLAHLSRIARATGSDYLNSQRESPAPKSPSLGSTSYRDPLAIALGQKLRNGISSVQQPPGFQKIAVSRNNQIQIERSYYNAGAVGPADSVGVSANVKKYHSLPDISGLSVPLREQYLSNKGSQWGGSIGQKSSVGRTNYEQSLYSNPRPRAGAPLAFDELSPSNVYRDGLQLNSRPDAGSLWSRQPFEQFGVADKSRAVGEGLLNKLNAVSQETTSVADSESKLLQSFRFCILKLLKLEGSEWLFRSNDGADEELINRVAAREKFLYEAETREMNQNMDQSQFFSSERKSGSSLKNDEAGFANFLISSVPHCGDGCIWKMDLIISFGVWCIHRILNMSLMESRPELWGKYTYVLNRLQGVIDLAFSQSRSPMTPCFCLQIPTAHQQRSSPPLSNGMMLPPAAKPAKGKCTNATMLLDLIKDIENAISSRKGRTGTAAGDVAFPKGKENLASVLKRYKRRLSNKPASGNEGPGSRKAPNSAAYGS